MSIWKRLAAATSNLTVGSPLAGLLAGNRESQDAPNRVELSDQPDNQVPFTLGIIPLSAKMAKADGRVTRDEVEAFKDAFKVSPGEMKEAARAFNLAKRDVTGYEVLASELVDLFKGNRKLLEDVLEGLFHIAKADEEVHPTEEQFLGRVAKLFGFTDAEFTHDSTLTVARTCPRLPHSRDKCIPILSRCCRGHLVAQGLLEHCTIILSR